MQLTPFRRPDLDPARFFRDLEHDFGRFPWAGWPFKSNGDTAWMPSVDVFEEGDSIVVKAELPGMTTDQVKLSVEDDCLVIEGERKSETEKKEKDYYYSERQYGSFYRRVPLPAPVDDTKAEATMKDGVLTLKAPRREPAPAAKAIPITAASSN
jgi:HSP20 family protein